MARGRVDDGPKSERHNLARRGLRRLINRSKTRYWKLLMEDIHSDPWGLGYKLVTQKLGVKKTSSLIDAAVRDRIVSVLFLSHPDKAALDFRNIKNFVRSGTLGFLTEN